jgi:hypothetical protein
MSDTDHLYEINREGRDFVDCGSRLFGGRCGRVRPVDKILSYLFLAVVMFGVGFWAARRYDDKAFAPYLNQLVACEGTQP